MDGWSGPTRQLASGAAGSLDAAERRWRDVGAEQHGGGRREGVEPGPGGLAAVGNVRQARVPLPGPFLLHGPRCGGAGAARPCRAPLHALPTASSEL